MCAGLLLSGAIAGWFASSKDTPAYFEGHPLVFVALLLILVGLMVWFGLGLRRIGAQTATFIYFLFVAINGLVFSVVFDLYTSAEIAPGFFAAAGMFGAAALYGFRTRRDLAEVGMLVFMAFWGVALAMLFNLLWASTAVYWLTTFGAVALFLAMAAVTVQGLKRFALEEGGADPETMAIFGALLLYLELVNTLLYALRFWQSR